MLLKRIHGSSMQAFGPSRHCVLPFRPLSRSHPVPTRCVASGAARSTARKGSRREKGGFGKSTSPRPVLEPWEEELLWPQYRAYYKPTFKPGRFLGPVVFKRDSEGAGSAYAENDIMGSQLLAVSHPLAFLEGALCQPPTVEDVHVQLLEEPPPPQVQKVLQMLPRRPPAKPQQQQAAEAAAVPAADAETDAAASTSSGNAAEEAAVSPMASSSSSSSSSGEQQPQQVVVPPDQLEPRYWAGERSAGVQPLASGLLMRVLQRSSWSEEYQDAAASQVRHERPAGFIGVWPEQAFLGHSCAPNTSVMVINRYLFIHATDDLPAGTELTYNKIGRAIISPLAARQQAVQQLTGRPCRCRRCQAEERLPQEVEQQLQQLYDDCGGRWAAAMQEGIMAQDTEALAELQTEVLTELNAFEDSLEEVAGLSEEERELVRVAVYDAYDLAWQLEELIEEQPSTALLEQCIELMKVFGRGSESHVFAATTQYQMLQARAEAMMAAAGANKRRTAAAERRLVKQVQELLEETQEAELSFFEAIYCRYGYIGDKGLLPQLVQGLALFYAGLRQMSTAGEDAEEGEAAGPVVRELELEGIPVTVVDTVDGISQQQEEGGSTSSKAGWSMINPKEAGALRVQFLEEDAPTQAEAADDDEDSEQADVELDVLDQKKGSA